MTAKKSAALHVVESSPIDLDRMEQEVIEATTHMRPSITRASVARERLKGDLAGYEAERAALIEKRTLAVIRTETFTAAIDDEIADLDVAIGLYSGVKSEETV
jgi:hypothetical protein